MVREGGTHQISDASLYHHEIWKTLEIDWKAMIAAWNSAHLSLSLIASNCDLFRLIFMTLLNFEYRNHEAVGSVGKLTFSFVAKCLGIVW